MGTLLKVFTVIILLLSILAFVMGLSNFGKRELLIGRTKVLEDKIQQLVRTIEKTAPVFEGVADHPERDESEVTERAVDSPELTTFWDSYEDSLELEANDFIRFDNQQVQLRSYYKLGADGKPEKDPFGQYVTKGPGTMDALLEDSITKAREQLKRLNDTRLQLTTVREELEKVIRLLNTEKRAHRASLGVIAGLRQEITALTTEIESKNSDINRLNREKADLQDTIEDRDRTIAGLNDNVTDLNLQIKRLDEQIKRTSIDRGTPNDGTTPIKTAAEITLTAGVKGSVVSVDKEWAYVVVKFTPEAKAEITGNGTGFAPVEMHVYRTINGESTIVTRLKITTPPNADNVSIASNVYGWEQMPVQPGDTVIY